MADDISKADPPFPAISAEEEFSAGQETHSDSRISDSHTSRVSSPRQALTVYSEFRSLDPRVVALWRVSHFIFFAIVLVSFLVGVGISWIESPEAAAFSGAGCLASAALFTWITLSRPGRLYRNWSYRIDERVLETRSGIIFKVSRLLPLNRLQHVDLHRGPLERAFGLASLVLHTAGTHDATITIPGLDAAEATRLRDHLIEVGGDDAV